MMDELPQITVVSMAGMSRERTMSVPVITISEFLYAAVTSFPFT